MNDQRHADTRTTVGPQLRRVARSGESTKEQRFAAIVVAFMDSHDAIDFDRMCDMLGLTHERLISIVEHAQMVVEQA